MQWKALAKRMIYSWRRKIYFELPRELCTAEIVKKNKISEIQHPVLISIGLLQQRQPMRSNPGR